MNECIDISLFHKNQIHSRKFSDILGRYYTPITIAEILCEKLGVFENCSVLDLGCGSGNLIIGSLKYWNNCNYHAYDIDIKAINILKSLCLENIHFYNVDIVNENIDNKYFDIAITNPPYIYLSKEKISASLDKNTQLENEIFKLNKIPVPLIFLTKALKSVKTDGDIGIILPNGILTNQKYQTIRNILINSYQVTSIIRLEPYAFDKTETYAHILIIKNTKPLTEYNINFYLLKDYKLVDHQLKSNQEIDNRLDFRKGDVIRSELKLGKYINSISRGRESSKFIKDNPSYKIFHTTDFGDSNNKYIPNQFAVKKPTLCNFAKKGDILIARVGRDFYKKIKIVRNNFIQISDSIIVIRPVENHTNLIYNYLKSDFGQEQLKVQSQGTGAKYITHNHILDLPLIENMENFDDF